MIVFFFIMSIGIPIKLLHEAQGHTVSVELCTGALLRGILHEAEDNMNIQMRDITITQRDGRVSQLDQVYIRGSNIRFVIVPDMLKNAPMFQNGGVKGKGVGRGTKTALTRGTRGRNIRRR